MTMRGIDGLPELFDALLGETGLDPTLEFEGLGHDADGEGAEVASHLGYDRGRARAGAAAHAGGDEDHVGPLEGLGDGVAILQGRLLADLGLAARPEAVGDLRPEAELHVGLGEIEGLEIGVGHDELDVLKAGPRSSC